jgi:Zn-dependent M28 family amino/carboxypeptidase
VGQGAQDDGFGCTAVMEAAALVAALPHRPRRTLRAVLYTNEENGLAGAKGYVAAHAGERHVAAIETDTGSGLPSGLRVDTRDDGARAARVIDALRPVAALLSAVQADHLEAGGSGADVGPLVEGGAIGFGVDHDLTHYFDVHHTNADTFDKIDPDSHRRTVAVLAVYGYALAELEALP